MQLFTCIDFAENETQLSLCHFNQHLHVVVKIFVK